MKQALLAALAIAAVTGCSETALNDSAEPAVTGPTAIVQHTGLPPEGCTPGFWKNHTEAWGPTGLSPSQTLESVFNIPDSLGLDNVTLLEALGLNGGGVNALLRHAVAGLLSSLHPDIVDYPAQPPFIIGPVNAALASGDPSQIEARKNDLDTWNNSGSPGFCD